MVAAAPGAAERDDILCAVSQRHAEGFGHEIDTCQHIGREQRDMPELSRPSRAVAIDRRHRRLPHADDIARRIDRETLLCLYLGFRLALGKMEHGAVRIAHPQPVLRAAGGSINDSAAMRRNPPCDLVQRICPQRHMVKAHPRAALQQRDTGRDAAGARQHRSCVINLRHQTGGGVERDARLKLRHFQREAAYTQYRPS